MTSCREITRAPASLVHPNGCISPPDTGFRARRFCGLPVLPSACPVPCRLWLRPSLGRPSPASQRVTCDLRSDPQLRGFTCGDLRPELGELLSRAGGRGLCRGHLGLWGASLEQEPRSTWSLQAHCPATSSSLSARCPRPPVGASWEPVCPDWSGLSCPAVMSRGPFWACADGVSRGLCPQSRFPPCQLLPSTHVLPPISCLPSSLSGPWRSTRSPIKASSWGPHFPFKVCILPVEVPRGERPLWPPAWRAAAWPSLVPAAFGLIAAQGPLPCRSPGVSPDVSPLSPGGLWGLERVLGSLGSDGPPSLLAPKSVCRRSPTAQAHREGADATSVCFVV